MCAEIAKYISYDDTTCVVDVGITTPSSSNTSECTNPTITIVHKADLVDLQVIKISRPLPSTIQLPLKELLQLHQDLTYFSTNYTIHLCVTYMPK